MKRRGVLLCVCVPLFALIAMCVHPAAARAQNSDSSMTVSRILDESVRKGRTIRVSTKDSVFVGRAVSATETELRLVGARMNVSDITAIERKAASDRNGMKRGMIFIGIPLALFLVALAASGIGMDETPGAHISIIGAAGILVMGGGLGALVGGVIGSIFNRQQTTWERVWPPPSAAEMRAFTGTFRVMHWNVADTTFVFDPERTRAIMRHADPDIIVMVEVAPKYDAGDVRRFLRGLRGPADTTWFISDNAIDGVEREIIASRDSVRPTAEFKRVAYADTGALAARAAYPATVRQPPEPQLVRTNAAGVRVDGKWLLVVAVHFKCCGVAGGYEEARRQLGATAIRDRVNMVLAKWAPRGIIIAGDMNLVSGTAALDTVLNSVQGNPWAPLRRAKAVREGGRSDGKSDWTWDGRGTEFPNGRLDIITYSAGTLNVEHARVWDTESMPADTLRANRLDADMSRVLNRHRPVVADFRFRRP